MAVSQVGHTVPFPPHHPQEMKEGKTLGKRQPGRSRSSLCRSKSCSLLLQTAAKSLPCLPPTPAASRTWISQGFRRGKGVSHPDLISSRQLTAADEPAVSWQGQGASRGQNFPRDNLSTSGATRGAFPGAERFFLKNQGYVRLPGAAATLKFVTLSPAPLFGGSRDENSPEKAPREVGKREGGGLAARAFFGPLSEPTKAALLDEPGRASR